MGGLERFLGLLPDAGPGPVLPVSRRLCAGDGRIFGGCLLAAAVAAAEASTGADLVSAGAVFLGPVAEATTVQLRCRPGRPGRRHGVVGAAVSGEVAGEAVLHLEAVLCVPPGTGTPRCWDLRPPPAPAPGQCPLRSYQLPSADSIQASLEVRMAGGDPARGRLVLWARLATVDETSAGILALLGDHLAFGAREIVGPRTAVRTLDCSLRISGSRPTDWYLLEVWLESWSDPIAHGSVRIWTADGFPLATVSQTLLLSAPGVAPAG